MSLATRCTACGTVFRVVQDQLKVSQGWVRCGRCQEVFNALEGLFDLEREAPPPWPPGSASATTGGDALPAESYPTAEPAARPGTETTEPPAARDNGRDGFADARFPSDAAEDTTGPLSVLDTVISTPGDLDADGQAPQFLRQAQREARWRRPAVRAVLAVAALMLALTLTAQIALHFRDGLATHWPESRPVLLALCAPLDCRIEPLRKIDSIVVDSSGLTTLNSGSGLYRFAVTLRNRGDATVMLPAIDLTLTDAEGQRVARKVITAAELGARQSSVAPGVDVSLQGVLSSGERRIVGYQVEIFYP